MKTSFRGLFNCGRTIFYQRWTADTQEAKQKAFERARKNPVEKVFLEVKGDLYILSFHDAGQTGKDPDNWYYVRAELPDGQDTLLRSVLVSEGWMMSNRYTGLYFV